MAGMLPCDSTHCHLRVTHLMPSITSHHMLNTTASPFLVDYSHVSIAVLTIVLSVVSYHLQSVSQLSASVAESTGLCIQPKLQATVPLSLHTLM